MSQYFDNDKNIKSEKRIIKFKFNDREFILYSDNGVFSKEKLDYGTRLLLENIDINNICGKVLDLGCGIGVVGIILGVINKNVSINLILDSKKEIETKKKDKMAFYKCSDEYTSVDLTLFPNIYEQYKEIEENTIINVSGKVDNRNNKIQIIVEKILIL